VLFVGFAIAVLATQLLLRYVFRYEVTEKAIKGLLFGIIPVFTLPVEDLVDVRRCSPLEVIRTPLAWRWGNRMWGAAVLVTRRRGLIRKTLLSPDAPDVFVDDVRAKMQAPRPPSSTL
jgi:hypothetical protein